jgi:hypothetical protein
MDWIGSVLDAAGGISGIFGTGGISAIFGGLFSWLEIRGKQKHDLNILKLQAENRRADRQMDIDELKQEGANAQALVKIDAEAKIEVAEIGGLIAAHEADKATYSNGFMKFLSKTPNWFTRLIMAFGAMLMFVVDFYRGVIRPSITCYGWFLISGLLTELAGTAEMLTPDQKFQIYLLIVNAVIFMTARATGFWFGDRGRLPKLSELMS